MSEDVVYEEAGEEQLIDGASSLSTRMKARSEELERQVSEVFEIPGWEDVLAVELNMVGWKKLRVIGQRNRKVKDLPTQELYVAIDQLITATDGFFEVFGDERKSINDTWVSLARRTGKPLPDNLTPRQAVLALVGDTRVMALYNSWQEWLQGERREVDEEVVRDFERTS